MSNNKQQTAVESIKTTFFHYAEPYPYFSEEEKWVITKEELFEILEQAKEMEKERMIEFYVKGCDDTRKINENYGLEYDKTYGLHFYNETYGGNK